MYKIFINDVALYLVQEQEWRSHQAQYANEDAQEYYFLKDDFDVENFLEGIENAGVEKNVLLIYSKKEELEEKFFSQYKEVEAAGGVVFNSKGKLLLIFRRGKWDLPKGKIDYPETAEEAALREVSEETGLQKLKIKKAVNFESLQRGMMHTYMINGKRFLKTTFWYEMGAFDENNLKPQEEEQIEQVKWVERTDLEKYYKNSYRSLQDIFKKYAFS